MVETRNRMVKVTEDFEGDKVQVLMLEKEGRKKEGRKSKVKERS